MHFKFHFDSINIICHTRPGYLQIPFKFHFDSINMIQSHLHSMNLRLFKFHFDSINIENLASVEEEEKPLNSTLILLI